MLEKCHLPGSELLKHGYSRVQRVFDLLIVVVTPLIDTIHNIHVCSCVVAVVNDDIMWLDKSLYKGYLDQGPRTHYWVLLGVYQCMKRGWGLVGCKEDII